MPSDPSRRPRWRLLLPLLADGARGEADARCAVRASWGLASCFLGTDARFNGLLSLPSIPGSKWKTDRFHGRTEWSPFWLSLAPVRGGARTRGRASTGACRGSRGERAREDVRACERESRRRKRRGRDGGGETDGGCGAGGCRDRGPAQGGGRRGRRGRGGRAEEEGARRVHRAQLHERRAREGGDRGQSPNPLPTATATPQPRPRPPIIVPNFHHFISNPRRVRLHHRHDPASRPRR